MEIFKQRGWKVSDRCSIDDVKLKAIELAPIWFGQTAVCIGGGPSLTQDQVDKVHGLRVIAINDAYKLAPWADILYACDAKWWKAHINSRMMERFTGYKLQHYYASRVSNMSVTPPVEGIDAILSSGGAGFDPEPNRIKHGGNSGYQALHVAMHLGAKHIILLGYDMHRDGGVGHWFGEHPFAGHADAQRYVVWAQEFPALADAAKERGQNIYNCTPGSKLTCFDNWDLVELLEHLRNEYTKRYSLWAKDSTAP